MATLDEEEERNTGKEPVTRKSGLGTFQTEKHSTHRCRGQELVCCLQETERHLVSLSLVTRGGRYIEEMKMVCRAKSYRA